MSVLSDVWDAKCCAHNSGIIFSTVKYVMALWRNFVIESIAVVIAMHAVFNECLFLSDVLDAKCCAHNHGIIFG